MSLAPRTLQIAYGQYVLPGTYSGTTKAALTRVHTLRIEPREFEVVFQVILRDSVANLPAGARAFEDAWRTTRKRIHVVSNAVTLIDYDHGDNSGFETVSQVRLIEDARSHGSRIYEVRVSGGLPFNNVDASHLNRPEFFTSVSLPATGRGQITISGTYTGSVTPKTGATANYRSYVATRWASLLTSLQAVDTEFAGTWYLADERFDPDDADQVVTFSRTYKQQLVGEAVGVGDDPDVGDSNLTIARRRVKQSDDPSSLGGTEPIPLRATYSASIDKRGSGSVTGTAAMYNLWDTRLQPWVMAQLRIAAGGKSVLVESESVTPNIVENTIEATIDAVAIANGALLSRRVTVTDDFDYGRQLVKLWPKTSRIGIAENIATPAYDFQFPKTIKRTVETVSRYAKDKAPNNFAALAAGQVLRLVPVAGGGVVPQRKTVRRVRSNERTAGAGDIVSFTDIVVTQTFELKGAASAGSEGRPTTQAGLGKNADDALRGGVPLVPGIKIGDG